MDAAEANFSATSEEIVRLNAEADASGD